MLRLLGVELFENPEVVGLIVALLDFVLVLVVLGELEEPLALHLWVEQLHVLGVLL